MTWLVMSAVPACWAKNGKQGGRGGRNDREYLGPPEVELEMGWDGGLPPLPPIAGKVAFEVGNGRHCPPSTHHEFCTLVSGAFNCIMMCRAYTEGTSWRWTTLRGASWGGARR